MNKEVGLTIDSQNLNISEKSTILDAAKKIGINIPTLCYHPDLKVNGVCRICLVEIKGRDHLECACSTPVEEGMEIFTHTQRVLKARRMNLELILSSHPTDCLICIKNGNCELQDLAIQLGLREELRFPNHIKTEHRDNTSVALNINSEKCIACERCVYICSEIQKVNALAIMERGSKVYAAAKPDLLHSPCVKCGQCTSYCPTGAIYEEEHTQEVWEALNNPEKVVVAQIAPSVRVALGEEFGLPVGTSVTKKIYTALKLLGVDYVFDTNFGADLTIMEEASEFVKRYKTEKDRLPLITSCCPAWVDYLEKFCPEFIDNFSSAKSPHQMLGVMVKTYWAEKMKIPKEKIFMVSIMPCTAKKYEILRCYDMFSSGVQDVDVTITTREFARVIKQAGIDLANLPDGKADAPLGIYSGAGLIFGATGGVMEAALRTAYEFITEKELSNIDFEAVRGLQGVKEAEVEIGSKKIRVAVAHGLGNVKEVLDRVAEGKRKNKLTYHFIEVMACPGGCVGGGGQPYGGLEIREKRAKAIYREEKEVTVRQSHKNPYIQQLYKEYLGEPLSDKARKLLHTQYYDRPLYGGDEFSCPYKDKLRITKG
ncbi:[FeFe] hydrogenase, group A [bacterium]|nr:[FeFe] hydrogenase, group A [bacterium]